MKRKKLPEKKYKGMYIYCGKCKDEFSWTQKSDEDKKIIYPICKKTGKRFQSCKHAAQHSYKVCVHIPGTKKGKTTKLLVADNYDQAVIEGIEFRTDFLRELKGEQSNGTAIINKLIYLLDAQVAYIDHYSDIDVPAHKKKHRSNQQISSLVRTLTLFNESMEKEGVNKKIIRCDKITDTHVGYFHSYIEEYAANTYNRFIGDCRGFFKWIIETYELKMTNPFEKINMKASSYDIETIEVKEFEDFLSLITHENGKVEKYTQSGKLVKKNMYRPYLKDAYNLALQTGCRREEIMSMKWSMIKEDKKGIPFYIEVPNLKVERSHKTLGRVSKVAPKIVPVTEGLRNILHEFGYEGHKNSDDFIISPKRDNVNIDWLTSILSRSFSHFYGLLENGKTLQFKCLRKTYLSYLNDAMKEDTKYLSSHKDQKVLDTHYIDPRIISEAVKNVQIFQKKSSKTSLHNPPPH